MNCLLVAGHVASVDHVADTMWACNVGAQSSRNDCWHFFFPEHIFAFIVSYFVAVQFAGLGIGQCPEIPEILRVVLKFTPWPEFFAYVLKFLSTPGHSMGTQAFVPASGNGRPCPCEPQTQLWTLETEGHTRTVTPLNVRNEQYTYITGFG